MNRLHGGSLLSRTRRRSGVATDDRSVPPPLAVVAALCRRENFWHRSRPRCFLLNLLWLLSALPGWIAFRIALRFPRPAQRRLLLRTCRGNCLTDFGQRHDLGGVRDEQSFRSAVPLGGYDGYGAAIAAVQSGRQNVLTGEPVLLLQPTSGTTSRPKLIPFTDGLRKQFQAAVDPWMADLYLRFPSLLFGAQYWSISPQTAAPAEWGASAVPVGFSDDGAYLGRAARWALQGMGVMPPTAHDPTRFQYATMLALLRERNLRLISVWHPSFLTILLDALPAWKSDLVRDLDRDGFAGRAREIEALDLSDPRGLGGLWPKLRVISCWGGPAAGPWVERLREIFPQAHLQPKGLIATEGVVSIPFGRDDRHVCAVRSHVIEFLDPETGSSFAPWEAQVGKEYTVALTTAGGLYRYGTQDRVRVTGLWGQTPYVEFVGREGFVSDLVGEKIHLRQAEEAIAAAEACTGSRFGFAMLAPDTGRSLPGYVLYADAAGSMNWESVTAAVEAELCRNFHYRHARNLGQLAAVEVCVVPSNADAAYREVLMSRGTKAGDVKFLRLMPDYGWRGELLQRPRVDMEC
jgi:hypothetical protein